MKKPKQALPKSVFIYAEEVDGKPFYVAVTDTKDIPYDHDGNLVGHYSLEGTSRFGVSIHLAKP